ncbi:hypothetical protein D3C85_225380 [compost metagenome]
MILRNGDFKTLSTLERAIFRECGVRIVFRAKDDTQLYSSIKLTRQGYPIIIDRMTVAQFKEMIRGPMRRRCISTNESHFFATLPMDIISHCGIIPAGQTLIKNVQFV